MFTILLDEQMTGDVDHLRALIESDAWNSLAELLGVQVTNFPEIGLPGGTSDRDVWQLCQIGNGSPRTRTTRHE